VYKIIIKNMLLLSGIFLAPVVLHLSDETVKNISFNIIAYIILNVIISTLEIKRMKKRNEKIRRL